MSACSANPHAVPSAPLPEIRVNGVLLDETAFANELQYHHSPDFNQVVQKAGQALVIRQLLLEQAKIQGLDVAGDEEQAISVLLQQQVSFDDPDEASCRRYFDNNQAKFMTLPLQEVDHILLAAAPDDVEARDQAKTLADQLIATLQQQPERFAELAMQHSVCPSKKTAGSLGQISKGQTVPEFERQLLKLPQGLAPQAIESRYGFHVVNISRKIPGQAMGYAMVAEKIRGYLVNRASHLAIQAYIQQLIDAADISGISLRFDEENIHI